MSIDIAALRLRIETALSRAATNVLLPVPVAAGIMDEIERLLEREASDHALMREAADALATVDKHVFSPKEDNEDYCRKCGSWYANTDVHLRLHEAVNAASIRAAIVQRLRAAADGEKA